MHDDLYDQPIGSRAYDEAHVITPLDVWEALDRYDDDLSKVVEDRPEINQWFIDQGYRFDFGIASEAYLIKNETVAQAATNREKPVDLLRNELRALGLYGDPQ